MPKHKIDFTRVNSDSNGNSRHVCHFLEFLGIADQDLTLDQKYAVALKRAATIGGRKFHNKQYGGGIVFQEQGGALLDVLAERIKKLAGEQRYYPMSRRACLVVKFHPSTGTNDNRWSVTIRDFPKRFYDQSSATVHGDSIPQWFAEKRIDELGLAWSIKSATTLPTGEHVFIVE